MNWFKNTPIYCDASATIPLDARVKKYMDKAEQSFGNPSAIYARGVESKKLLTDARARVATHLKCKPSEIYFTSGGTESNNLALLGIVEKLVKEGRLYNSLHIITSVIEHSSILEVCSALELKGVRVDRVGVNAEGLVLPSDVQSLITPNTVLVSVMYANNEIGTIQPLGRIGKIVKEEIARRDSVGENTPVYFHTDASQAPVFLSLDMEKLGVHMMTLDGHKIYGPRGVGALAIKRQVRISPILFGGGQESSLRPTTENVSGIVGLSHAIHFAQLEKEEVSEKMRALQNEMVNFVQKELPQAIINGSLENRLPHTLNISLPNIDPEFTVLKLDQEGIECSTKSSCLKGEEESYVVKALGGESFRARNTLRFSFLKTMTRGEIKKVNSILKKILV